MRLRVILFAFKQMHFGGGAEKNLIDVALHVAKRHPVGFYIAGGFIDPRMAAAGPVFTMPGRGRFWLAPLDLLHLAWVVYAPSCSPDACAPPVSRLHGQHRALLFRCV